MHPYKQSGRWQDVLAEYQAHPAIDHIQSPEKTLIIKNCILKLLYNRYSKHNIKNSTFHMLQNKLWEH